MTNRRRDTRMSLRQKKQDKSARLVSFSSGKFRNTGNTYVTRIIVFWLLLEVLVGLLIIFFVIDL